MKQQVSVGRIVLVPYRSYDTPAIVTNIHADEDGTVDVFAFGHDLTGHQDNIKYSEEPTSGTWRWPPKVG